MDISERRLQTIRARAYDVVELNQLSRHGLEAGDTYDSRIDRLLASACFAYSWHSLVTANGDLEQTPSLAESEHRQVNVDEILDDAKGALEYLLPQLLVQSGFTRSEGQQVLSEILDRLRAETTAMPSGLVNRYREVSGRSSVGPIPASTMSEFAAWVERVTDAVFAAQEAIAKEDQPR